MYTRCSDPAVAWDYTIPFGLMYAPTPSPQVQRFLQAIRALK